MERVMGRKRCEAKGAVSSIPVQPTCPVCGVFGPDRSGKELNEHRGFFVSFKSGPVPPGPHCLLFCPPEKNRNVILLHQGVHTHTYRHSESPVHFVWLVGSVVYLEVLKSEGEKERGERDGERDLSPQMVSCCWDTDGTHWRGMLMFMGLPLRLTPCGGWWKCTGLTEGQSKTNN